ncbi:polysaccharide biosynthesis/export family protein [Thermopirellula anaerolimosa]
MIPGRNFDLIFPDFRSCGRFAAALSLIAVLTLAASGCRTMDFYDPGLEQTPASADLEPPRELAKVSLPAYRLEPPDVVQIEVPKMVPLPPYRLEVYDVLQVDVIGTLLDQPIAGYYMVEAEGTINLGPAYGSVRVAGMTVEEARWAIDQHLRRILRAPEVAVQLARASGLQPIGGVYLVGPDGTLNLKQYGAVYVAGMTLPEAREAVRRHLSQFLDSPDVSLEVLAYNSKVYYVITEGPGEDDNVIRLPCTGNETVLDAVAQVGGVSQVSSKKIWIARPSPAGTGCEQVLPVDWNAITRGGNTATNYQVLPGDRIFIAHDEMIAMHAWIDKMVAPVERLFGFTSLGTSTVRSLQTMGRGYNQNRSGF